MILTRAISPPRTFAASSWGWTLCAKSWAPTSTSPSNATGATTLRDVIELAKALEHVKPMWLEDPVPPENPEAMARVRTPSMCPICTGENLYTRHGFRKLIELQACDAVHIDIPKSGGLLESKRISELADLYYIWTAAHNPASPVGTIASAHAASSMRSFRVHELAKYIDWWQDLVIHEGPIIEAGYLTIQDKPGYGVEINPDVAKAHSGARGDLVGVNPEQAPARQTSGARSAILGRVNNQGKQLSQQIFVLIWQS